MLKASRRGTDIASATLIPGKFMVNIFPSCKLFVVKNAKRVQANLTKLSWMIRCTVLYVPSWFPGAEWKRKSIAWRKIIHDIVHEPFDGVKKAEVSLV